MFKQKLPTTPAEFWKACDRNGDCWFYNHGFLTRYQGRLILAHRLAWELHHHKQLPSYLTLVLHTCGEKKCVNPAHLYVDGQSAVDSRRSTPKKFWARVDKNGPVIYKKLGRCWVWTGGKYNHGGGYGQACYGRKGYPAHRLAWLLTYGSLPKDKLVCHKCDNPPCVRPSHMFLGVPKTNSADMVAKGRQKGRPPLTAEDVREMRELHKSGMSVAEVARRYSMNYACMYYRIKLAEV